eukprot:scaffold674_cov371-Prasinococcus_capsulatus_cf.AAC.3
MSPGCPIPLFCSQDEPSRQGASLRTFPRHTPPPGTALPHSLCKGYERGPNIDISSTTVWTGAVATARAAA